MSNNVLFNYQKSQQKHLKAMFTKKNKSENNQQKNTTESWINGKLASFLIGTAIGATIYQFKIIPKIINYFKKPTPPTDNAYQGGIN